MKTILKNTLVSLLSLFGYDVIKKLDMRNMSTLLHQVRSMGLAPQAVIDVGVAYGTPELYEAFPTANQILIEPVAEWEPVMRKICEKYKGTYMIAAAGREPGCVEINLHNKLSSSSMLRETDGGTIDGKARSVPVITLDDVCSEQKLLSPMVLKIDVQGYELEVLAGATKMLQNCELVIVECSLFRFMQGGPELYDVLECMKEHGFVVYDLFGWHNRPIDNALAQVDVAFVKENGMFRTHHRYATEAQRSWELGAQELMLK